MPAPQLSAININLHTLYCAAVICQKNVALVHRATMCGQS